MPAVMERETRPAEPVNAIRIDSLITYPIDIPAIVELREKYADLNADTPKGFDACKVARAKVRSIRTDVEYHRQMLKKGVIEAGKRIDNAARELTNELIEVEKPLDDKIKAVEAIKAKEKADREAAERARVDAELKERAEAHERKLKAERDAEEARIREEREKVEADRKKLEAEKAAADAERKRLDDIAREKQAKIDADNAERQRIKDAEQAAKQKELDDQKAALEAEKRKLEADKIIADRKEFERKTQLEAEQKAKEKAEADRVAKEKADADQKAKEEQERARIEAIKPDVTKVHDFARRIRDVGLYAPALNSKEAEDILRACLEQLIKAAELLESFQAS